MGMFNLDCMAADIKKTMHLDVELNSDDLHENVRNIKALTVLALMSGDDVTLAEARLKFWDLMTQHGEQILDIVDDALQAHKEGKTMKLAQLLDNINKACNELNTHLIKDTNGGISLISISGGFTRMLLYNNIGNMAPLDALHYIESISDCDVIMLKDKEDECVTVLASIDGYTLSTLLEASMLPVDVLQRCKPYLGN